jgi:hypothetical protein
MSKEKSIAVKNGKQIRKNAVGNWEGSGVGTIKLAQVETMNMREFARVKERLLTSELRTFYDHAAIVGGTPIGKESKELFVAGYNQPDDVWNTNAAIAKKGLLMTNMEEGGQFMTGTGTILERIEVDIHLSGATATSFKHFVFPSNTAAVTVPNYQPSLCFFALRNQIKLELVRGANSQIIVSGKLEDFPGNNIATGAGSNDFFIQNGPGVSDEKLMRPEVFAGDEDFKIRLTPLNPDLVLPVNVHIEVKFKTLQSYQLFQ